MSPDDNSTVGRDTGWTPASPHFHAIVTQCLERQEFMKHIGCRLTAIEPGHVEAQITLDKRHQQHDGLSHGGVIATLADVVAGFSVYTLLTDDQLTVTVDMMISFLEAATGTHLRAVGRVVRHGTTTSFARAEVFACTENKAERLIAIAQATFAVRNRLQNR
ncbi:MAG: PaaI family thioesterase [Chlorobi bacterium]|nr:PaaI family thioesterase [Chlorobiota bacterium]